MTNNPDYSSLKEWLDWLESEQPIDAIQLGLSRVKEVAARLCLLKPNIPVVTVAGTNGKGSTIACIEALAKTHHLNVGSFTSPHLFAFNERVKINSKAVSDNDLISAFKEVAEARQNTVLSYFEFAFLVALQVFKHKEIDILALEVGLGGRLDAVNIIDPSISIITSISIDHTEWLGSDLQSIAKEKAGIMRKERPVILAQIELEPLLKESISCYQASPIICDKNYHISQQNEKWTFNFNKLEFDNLNMPNLYLPNVAAALCAWAIIFEKQISQANVNRSMKYCELIGRFQLVNSDFNIFIDVAHNPDSAKLLNNQIQRQLIQANAVIANTASVWSICGMLKDKDISKTISQLNHIDHWLIVDLPGERGASSELVELFLVKVTESIKNFRYIRDAVEYYLEHRNKDDILVIFGSFVTASLAYELLRNNNLIENENKVSG